MRVSEASKALGIWNVPVKLLALGIALGIRGRLSESSAAPRRSAPPRRNVAQPQHRRSAAAVQPHCSCCAVQLQCSCSAALQPQRSCSAAALQPQRSSSAAAEQLHCSRSAATAQWGTGAV
eukprot:gene14957-biopygen5388